MPVYKYDTKKGVKWYYSFKFQDVRYLKRGFDTKREAIVSESEKRVELEKFGQLEKRIKLDTFCELYLSDLEKRESRYTFEKATTIINKYILPNLKNKYIDEYKTRDISNWQNTILSLNISNTYTHTIDARMRALFNHAIKFSTIHKSPCAGVKTIGKQNRDAKDHAVWTIDDWKRINDFGSVEFEAFMSVLFYTGMRIGEVMGLMWSDVNFEEKKIYMNKQRLKNGEIKKTKTGNSIEFLVNDKLINTLKKYKSSLLEETNFIFNKSRDCYRKNKNKLEKKYDLPHIRIHDMRHSHATLLINNDVNIHVIADRLGHSSTKTTERVYAHLYEDNKKQVVDLLESLDLE